MIIIVAFLFKY